MLPTRVRKRHLDRLKSTPSTLSGTRYSPLAVPHSESSNRATTLSRHKVRKTDESRDYQEEEIKKLGAEMTNLAEKKKQLQAEKTKRDAEIASMENEVTKRHLNVTKLEETLDKLETEAQILKEDVRVSSAHLQMIGSPKIEEATILKTKRSRATDNLKFAHKQLEVVRKNIAHNRKMRDCERWMLDREQDMLTSVGKQAELIQKQIRTSRAGKRGCNARWTIWFEAFRGL